MCYNLNRQRGAKLYNPGLVLQPDSNTLWDFFVFVYVMLHACVQSGVIEYREPLFHSRCKFEMVYTRLDM